jgi:hypothetical protein
VFLPIFVEWLWVFPPAAGGDHGEVVIGVVHWVVSHVVSLGEDESGAYGKAAWIAPVFGREFGECIEAGKIVVPHIIFVGGAADDSVVVREAVDSVIMATVGAFAWLALEPVF